MQPVTPVEARRKPYLDANRTQGRCGLATMAECNKWISFRFSEACISGSHLAPSILHNQLWLKRKIYRDKTIQETHGEGDNFRKARPFFVLME